MDSVLRGKHLQDSSVATSKGEMSTHSSSSTVEPCSPKTPTTVCSSTTPATPECTPRSVIDGMSAKNNISLQEDTSPSTFVGSSPVAVPLEDVYEDEEVLQNVGEDVITSESAASMFEHAAQALRQGCTLDIVVLGAGPAALGAALALHNRTGRLVYVLEKNPFFHPREDSVVRLPTNGFDALRCLSEEAAQQLFEGGSEVVAGEFWEEYLDEPVVKTLKAERGHCVILRRSELRKTLLNHCLNCESGIRIYLCSDLESVEECSVESNEFLQLKFADGLVVNSKLVISTTPTSFAPARVLKPKADVGVARVHYQAIIPSNRCPTSRNQIWTLRGSSTVCMVTPASVHMTAWMVVADQPPQMAGSKSVGSTSLKECVLGLIGSIANRYGSRKLPQIFGYLRRLVERTKDDEIERHVVADTQWNKGGSWPYPIQKRGVSIGDMALEDSVQLAYCMSDYPGDDARALERFSEIQKHRLAPAMELNLTNAFRCKAFMDSITTAEGADEVPIAFRVPNFVPVRSRVEKRESSPQLMGYSASETEYM